MELGLLLFILGSWIWSVARGIQVSLLCAILNFLFPPFSQAFYAFGESKMRAPLLFMVAGSIAFIYFFGEPIVTAGG